MKSIYPIGHQPQTNRTNNTAVALCGSLQGNFVFNFLQSTRSAFYGVSRANQLPCFFSTMDAVFSLSVRVPVCAHVGCSEIAWSIFLSQMRICPPPLHTQPTTPTLHILKSLLIFCFVFITLFPRCNAARTHTSTTFL